MSSAVLNDLFKAGKSIIADTKTTRKEVVKVKKVEKGIPPLGTPGETDPHKSFVKRTIQELPKKSVVIDGFKKFIDQAEADL